MRWKSLLVGGLLLAGVAAALGFSFSLRSRAKVLTLPGMVEVHEVRLGPRVAGRVQAVLVTEGDHVKEGQELVRLDVPELVAQRAMLLAR
jgi:HlyD family secretion protein